MKKKNISEQLLNQIKKIKIFTKRLTRSSLVSDYLSAFKGAGLEFDQIREYQMGDDIRFIDWNKSARMNKIMVKQFIEERDRLVILAIDVSASSFYSSKKELKKELIAQVSAALAFIASENKDRVGALFFSDRIEKWIPPSKGHLTVGKIIETIFAIEPEGKKTDIKEALNFLIRLKKRNSIIFMISDWIDLVDEYSNILKVASCEYDFVGVRVLDDCEKNMPNVGLLDIQDCESGSTFVIDTKVLKKHNKHPEKKVELVLSSSTKLDRAKAGRIEGSRRINVFLTERLLKQKRLFNQYKIDLLDLNVGKSFINPLINFFKQRTRRQI